MGVEKFGETASGKLNKTNSVDIYRPPALRKLDALYEKNGKVTEKSETKNSELNNRQNRLTEKVANNEQSNTTSNRPVRRERRPDRAVYIPRARRSLTTPPQVNTTIVANNFSGVEPTSNISLKNADDANKKSNVKQIIDTTVKKSSKLSRSSFPHTITTTTTSIKEYPIPNSFGHSSVISNNCDKHKSTTIPNHIACISQDSYSLPAESKTDTIDTTVPNINCDKTEKLISSEIAGIDTVDSIQNNNLININHLNSLFMGTEYKTVENTALRIEDVASDRKFDKDDKDIEELQRASKEINRSNRCLMKQTFNSDILEIPDTNLITTSLMNQSNDIDESISKDIDQESDDWDSMFDDNGECIDPKIISELTATVGKVKIEKPKTDYKTYHIKQSILNDEEFPHVLEISNFPIEFKTHDLMMIFSSYKESGFDIKWVDDTHALAVFSSSKIAAEVLAMGHPFVLLKPLAEATVESRTKAKKCSSSLQPYRQRPETCAALARRLVTGALGVRLKTAPEERENEKRVLREAKERKLLAAKQRDEAWES